MLRRLFSKKSEDDDHRDHHHHDHKKEKGKNCDKIDKEHLAQGAVGVKKKMPERQKNVDDTDGGSMSSEKYEKKTSSSSDRPRKVSTAVKKKAAKRKESSGVKVDTNVPIEYPCTPEIILEYHKLQPFLSTNEEWLLVELNEFECLVDSEDIIKVIAKHSKFFEVDPDELWVEFFDYVESIPAYDEVINYDIWQEFRDEKYPC